MKTHYRERILSTNNTTKVQKDSRQAMREEWRGMAKPYRSDLVFTGPAG